MLALFFRLDNYLFQFIAHFLHSRRFNNQEEVETSVKKFFALKEKNWYQHRIKELPVRWHLTVQHNGLYFKCLVAFVVTWRIKQICVNTYYSRHMNGCVCKCVYLCTCVCLYMCIVASWPRIVYVCVYICVYPYRNLDNRHICVGVLSANVDVCILCMNHSFTSPSLSRGGKTRLSRDLKRLQFHCHTFSRTPGNIQSGSTFISSL